MKDSKSKSKPSKKILDTIITSQIYYAPLVRGKVAGLTDEMGEFDPFLYPLDELHVLRREYPRSRIVKVRITYEVISEVIP